MQKLLFDYDEQNKLQPEYQTDVGKAVRNANYHMNQDKFQTERALVLQTIIMHPEGLTDQEIADMIGLKRSSVNGRRNELMHEGLVRPVGIATYDYEGRNIVNTMWGVY